jgi:hypothetical protein
MSHQLCRECHHLVSEEARTCPHCGISGPRRPDEADGWLVLALILWALAIVWFRHQVALLSAPSLPLSPPAPHSASGQLPLR